MRWKFIIPAGIIFALIAAFNILFLDAIIKNVMISGGEMALGAKVEISKVKTNFRNFSIIISGLNAADKSDPWKNIFEVDSMRFSLEPVPLLSKKFIIDEMSVQGIRWGTKRTSSGALPPKKIAKLEKISTKDDKDSLTAKLLGSIEKKAKSEVSQLPPVETIKSAENEYKNVSVEKMVSATDLKSIAEMDTMKSDIAGKYSQYDAKLKDFKIEDSINRVNQAIDVVSKIKISSVQDVEPAKKQLESLNASKQELEKTISDLKSFQSQFSSDFGTEANLLNKINELRKSDYDKIASNLKLPSFSFGNIAQQIFGPVWIGRVNGVMHYIHLARKYMPPRKKEQKKVTKTRMKGTDVSFPLENVPPDFLIRKIVISGSTGRAGKDGASMDFNGTVTDITSDPALLGRPTKMEITGSGKSQKLVLNGIFDHSRGIPVDYLTIILSGIPSKDLNIPDSDYLPSFENSTAQATAKFALLGDNIDSQVDMNFRGVSVKLNKDIQADEMKKTIANLWAGVESVVVSARLSGTFEKLNVSVTSNVDKILSEKLKKLYGAKIAEIQNKLKAEIDRLTQGKQKEVMSQFNTNKEAIQKQFASKENEAKQKIEDAKSAVTKKQNEMTAQSEAEKKKAEEELKQKAGDKLKELFK